MTFVISPLKNRGELKYNGKNDAV